LDRSRDVESKVATRVNLPLALLGEFPIEPFRWIQEMLSQVLVEDAELNGTPAQTWDGIHQEKLG
jgi:hypothetical protein